jgi:hypothetical protein
MAYHLCSELVSVAWDDTEGCGNLEEIGEWTAMLLLEDPVPRGAKVHIQCQEHQLRGFAETCTFEEPLGFFVGVRLDSDSRWSEEWFTPQHLLALQSGPFPKAFHLGMASGY